MERSHLVRDSNIDSRKSLKHDDTQLGSMMQVLKESAAVEAP